MLFFGLLGHSRNAAYGSVFGGRINFPAGLPSMFTECNAVLRFENAAKMGDGAKAQGFSDLLYGSLVGQEQPGGLPQLDVPQHLKRPNACLLAK